jgi:hypothetical protein
MLVNCGNVVGHQYKQESSYIEAKDVLNEGNASWQKYKKICIYS